MKVFICELFRVSLITCTAAVSLWLMGSSGPQTWWSPGRWQWWRDTGTWEKAAFRRSEASALESSSPRLTPSTLCRPLWRVSCSYFTHLYFCIYSILELYKIFCHLFLLCSFVYQICSSNMITCMHAYIYI